MRAYFFSGGISLYQNLLQGPISVQTKFVCYTPDGFSVYERQRNELFPTIGIERVGNNFHLQATLELLENLAGHIELI